MIVIKHLELNEISACNNRYKLAIWERYESNKLFSLQPRVNSRADSAI